MDDNIIYGKNSILETLVAGNREINKIIISKTIHSDSKLNQIKALAKENGIVYQFCGREKFKDYDEVNHQGVIAYVSPIKYSDIDEFLANKNNSSIVILDGIEDSHNIGAMIRTCVCAGIDGVVIPSRRNVQINAIVEKTSAGAINHIPIIRVNSLINLVQKLKESDWWIVAADASARDNYYDIKFNDMKFALVMGAEHAGISKSILKASDFIVKIPMQREFNSLNVSNAMSVIVYESLRQKLSNK